jgi:hypothetical protein
LLRTLMREDWMDIVDFQLFKDAVQDDYCSD